MTTAISHTSPHCPSSGSLLAFLSVFCFFFHSRCWRGTSSCSFSVSARLRFRSVCFLPFVPFATYPLLHFLAFFFSFARLFTFRQLRRVAQLLVGLLLSLRPAALAVGLAIGRGDGWGWVGVIYSGSGWPPGGGGGSAHTRGRDRHTRPQWVFFFLGFLRGIQHGSGLARDFWFHRWTDGREGSIGKVRSCYRFSGAKKGLVDMGGGKAKHHCIKLLGFLG